MSHRLDTSNPFGEYIIAVSRSPQRGLRVPRIFRSKSRRSFAVPGGRIPTLGSASVALSFVLVLVGAPSAMAVTVDVAGAELNFGATDGTNNQPTTIGDDAEVGFSHLYRSVYSDGTTTVDALVTILGQDNLEEPNNSCNGTIQKLDDSSETGGKEIQLEVDVCGVSGSAGFGFVDFRVEFVNQADSLPVTLQNIAITVEDVDESQFVSFSGPASYILNDPTEITVSEQSGAYTFLSSSLESESSDPKDYQDKFVVQVNYDSLSVIDIRAGAYEAGEAWFDFAFKSFDFTEAVLTPVPLNVYSLSYVGTDASCGTPPATQQSTTESRTITVTGGAGTLQRENYVFESWNSSENGDGIRYETGSVLDLTSNITLYAQWSAAPGQSVTCPAPSTTSRGVIESASAPAIHLDILAPEGTKSTNTPVLFEGEGLAKEAPYTLRLGPSGQVLKSGLAGKEGYFSNTVNLPDLSPGRYYVVLSTTAADGSELTLTIPFTIGPGGILTYVGDATLGSTGSTLAQTGPDGPGWPVTIAFGLSVVGLALILSGYRLAGQRAQAEAMN